MSGVCEPEAAIARLGGDVELYQELIRSFLDDSAGLVPRLAEAVAAGDSEAVHKASHNLKGTAATCGATSVADVCAKMEQSALERDLSPVADLFAQLNLELAEAARRLSDYYG
jgi:HPt (histidine-containing phosphotransfer) domain-containing protein